jgi:hypothetical protein
MKKIGVLVVLSLVLFVTAQAQSDQERADLDELANIGKSLKEKINKEMPGWTHRSIEPIQGSQRVIIQQWELGDIVVKIAVTKYRELEQAKSTFKDFRTLLNTQEQASARNQHKQLHLIKEELSTLGDEGLVADVRGSEAVAFRKGQFLVDVSVPRPETNKDGFFSRKFAEHVAKVLERQ